MITNGLVPNVYGGMLLSGCPDGSVNTYYYVVQYYQNQNATGSFYAQNIYGGDYVILDASDNNKNYIRIYANVKAGATVNNAVFYPMIRRADITDPTYEPYHESVKEEIEQIYADNGVLGAKNLLKVTANTQTINGVTFTVNADGSVTVNGTASAIAFFPIVPNNTMTIKKGSYILSAGDGIIGNYSKYGLYINTASGDIANTRAEENTHFALSADILITECKIFVTSGTTVSNLVFKPMIRLASDPDDTYVPHAMTNRELTEKKINIADLKTVVSASSDFTDFKTRIASL
jgi:hypothetical protein